MEPAVNVRNLDPGGEQTASAFYEHYDELIELFCPDYREMIEAAADAVPRLARTVVDLGCGTGTLMSALMARRPALERMTGMDLNPALLAAAAGKLRVIPASRWTLIEGDILRAPLPVADAYVSSLVLHNLNPVDQAMAYRRVARATETFVQFEVVAGENEAGEAERWEYLAWTLKEKGVPEEVRDFTVAHMRESDHPLALSQHRKLCDAVGLELRVLKTAPGFAVFRADQRL